MLVSTHIVQPVVANVTVAEGDNTELTCDVGTTLQVPLEFQWFRNGVMLEDERYTVIDELYYLDTVYKLVTYTVSNIHCSQIIKMSEHSD